MNMMEKTNCVYELLEEILEATKTNTDRVTRLLNKLALDAGYYLEDLKFCQNDINKQKEEYKNEYLEMFDRHFD